MTDTTKSVGQLLREVREELARLNNVIAPSLPRFAVDGALRIVEKPQSTNTNEARRLDAAA
jgi:hypothetical protein